MASATHGDSLHRRGSSRHTQGPSSSRRGQLPPNPSLRDLKTLPVEVLRLHLAHHNLVTTGRRAQLEERLRAHLTTRSATNRPQVSAVSARKSSRRPPVLRLTPVSLTARPAQIPPLPLPARLHMPLRTVGPAVLHPPSLDHAGSRLRTSRPPIPAVRVFAATAQLFLLIPTRILTPVSHTRSGVAS